MPPRTLRTLAMLLLTALPPAFALSIAIPPFEEPVVEVLPPDSARTSATVLHTRSRNWLQFQLAPVGPCQQVVVDSVVVRDTALPDTGIRILPYGNPAPRRDLEVRWHLVQNPQRSVCQEVMASRQMLELPRARWNPGSDSLLLLWAPERIEAQGPLGRTERIVPSIVDQTDEMSGGICPNWSIVCKIGIREPSDTANHGAFLGLVRDQIAKGRPVVRIAADGSLRRAPMPPADPWTIASLGSRESPWNLGQQPLREEFPLRTVQSWGAVGVPATWVYPTGRRIVAWHNTPPVCCTRCDTICDPGPVGRTLSVSGFDVEVANDSTRDCAPGSPIDGRIAQDMAQDWIVFPDSAETRNGLLTRNLRPDLCGERIDAWPVVGDSVRYEGVGIALSELSGPTVGVRPHAVRRPARIVSTREGLRIETDFAPGTEWTVAARGPSGRILSSSSSRGRSVLLPLALRGAIVVEIRGPDGSERRLSIR